MNDETKILSSEEMGKNIRPQCIKTNVSLIIFIATYNAKFV